MDSHVALLLHRHPLLGCLAIEDWRRIGADTHILRLAANALLYRQGDPAEHLHLIVDGTLLLRDPAHSADGLGPLGVGEVVGTEALVAASHHSHDAVAIGALSLWPIPASRLIARLEENFNDALAMIAAQAVALRRRVKEIAEYKMQSTAERLARYLLALAGVDSGPALVHLRCEKRVLAERLGMDPATLSRSFAKLRRYSVEAQRRDQVAIADVSQLWEVVSREDIEPEEEA